MLASMGGNHFVHTKAKMLVHSQDQKPYPPPHFYPTRMVPRRLTSHRPHSRYKTQGTKIYTAPQPSVLSRPPCSTTTARPRLTQNLPKTTPKGPYSTVLDFENLPPNSSFSVTVTLVVNASIASAAFSTFSDGNEDTANVESSMRMYKFASVPGLLVIPNQSLHLYKYLLRRLLFRDLSDPPHNFPTTRSSGRSG